MEDAIYSNPAIAEACVFGVPDERFGEVPALVYYCKPGEDLSKDALTSFLAEHLAAFKIPVHIWQYDEPLPKLGTAKIAKIILSAKHKKILEEAA